LSLLSKNDKPWFLNWGKTSCYTHHTFLLGFPTGWLFTTHKESSGAVNKDLKNKKLLYQLHSPTSTWPQQHCAPPLSSSTGLGGLGEGSGVAGLTLLWGWILGSAGDLVLKVLRSIGLLALPVPASTEVQQLPGAGSELIIVNALFAAAILCRKGVNCSTSMLEAFSRHRRGCSSSLWGEVIRSPLWREGPWWLSVVGRGLPSSWPLLLGGDASRTLANGGDDDQGHDCLLSFCSRVLFVKEMILSVGWVYPEAALLQGHFCILYSPRDKQWDTLGLLGPSTVQKTRLRGVVVWGFCQTSCRRQSREWEYQRFWDRFITNGEGLCR
jgi:hypothetical protein